MEIKLGDKFQGVTIGTVIDITTGKRPIVTILWEPDDFWIKYPSKKNYTMANLEERVANGNLSRELNSFTNRLVNEFLDED